MIRRIDRWLFTAYESCGGETGSLFRIVYAFAFLMLKADRGLWLTEMNDAFFFPALGIGLLMDGFPAPAVLHGLNLTLILLGFALLVGWRTRAVSILLSLGMILMNAWAFSTGKINHSILFDIAPFVLAFSGWGNHFSIDAARAARNGQAKPYAERSWPILLFGILVGLGLLTAIEGKVQSGWLSFDSQAVRAWTFGFFIRGEARDLSGVLLAIDSPVFWEFFDWMTIVTEGSFIIFALRIRWLRAFLPVICLFHAGIFYILGISFSTNIIAYGAFVNWGAVVPQHVRDALTRLADRLRVWHIIPFALLLWGRYLLLPRELVAADNPFFLYVFWPCIIAGCIWSAVTTIRSIFGSRSDG